MPKSGNVVPASLEDGDLYRVIVPRVAFHRSWFRGKAWRALLEAHPDVPESHWRKDHDAETWGWYAVAKCQYAGCETCYPKQESEQ